MLVDFPLTACRIYKSVTSPLKSEWVYQELKGLGLWSDATATRDMTQMGPLLPSLYPNCADWIFVRPPLSTLTSFIILYTPSLISSLYITRLSSLVIKLLRFPLSKLKRKLFEICHDILLVTWLFIGFIICFDLVSLIIIT